LLFDQGNKKFPVDEVLLWCMRHGYCAGVLSIRAPGPSPVVSRKLDRREVILMTASGYTFLLANWRNDADSIRAVREQVLRDELGLDRNGFAGTDAGIAPGTAGRRLLRAVPPRGARQVALQ